MVGDLSASKIKREFVIKDFGNFLPGHGGVLDRFDSVLFVAPVVYYFISYFI
jgi:phosphatidate cytidylyltransferase